MPSSTKDPLPSPSPSPKLPVSNPHWNLWNYPHFLNPLPSLLSTLASLACPKLELFDLPISRNRSIFLGFRETLEGGIALVGMRNPRMGADGQCWNNGIGFYCVEGEVPVIL
ncbi:hypothetical protein Droror1_Dr00014945 [Drosera rotundifolia]